MPLKIYMKFFQPLSEQIRAGRFTTKPTGQGTGLGLSLSYDILKVHGGKLEVHSEAGTGTTFTILLNHSNQ